MTTLYHYIHCPFCLRVRMAFGLLKVSYNSAVLSYDDEKTPIKLTNKKMLPIVSFDDETLNESLDIIKKADSSNLLKLNLLENQELRFEVENLLTEIAGPVHNLVMPYWVYTKEFSPAAREYFLKKKEAKRGPFGPLMARKQEFLDELDPIIVKLETKLTPFYNGESNITIFDIMIASHLWGMYLFPEFQFPPFLHNYLQEIKRKTNFEYHQDFWN